MNFEIRETIVRHSRSKMNGVLPDISNHRAKMTSPHCGDHVELAIQTDGYRIESIGFKTSSCVICAASASILCEEIRHLSVDQALKIAGAFETEILTSSQEQWPEHLYPLRYFEHIRQNPERKVCVLLPWIVLRIALKENEDSKRLN